MNISRSVGDLLLEVSATTESDKVPTNQRIPVPVRGVLPEGRLQPPNQLKQLLGDLLKLAVECSLI